MGTGEIAWRIRTAAGLPLDYVRYRTGARRCVVSLDAVLQGYPIQPQASGVPLEHFRIFDLEFPVGFEFDWHRDYRNSKQVPKSFALSLDIRDPAAVGDIKYLWEVNRHQHLSALAYASGGTEDEIYILRSLHSWLRENPYLCGVNWTSSLELALRVISWSLLYPRVAAGIAQDRDLLCRWANSIYLHLHRIQQRPSLYSSANNHLIGELVGLYIGATCFPLWPECCGWASDARESLEREIGLQVSEDGVNREQATAYHLFTLELLLLAFTVAKNVGERFSKNFEQRLKAMLSYLAALATRRGELPWYGDSDDARGFVFSTTESPLAVTTQLGGLLFNDTGLLRFSNKLTTATQALLPNIAAISAVPGPPFPRSELFRDGGVAVVESRDGDRKLVMDFGPHGYTNIAAHAHADALSIWFAIGDAYFLVDSGTFAYHSYPAWRAFFRGTSAHNTARIDGKDQSEIGGPFLWVGKVNARLLSYEDSGSIVSIVAEHDGYTRLDDPVVHRRSVDFDRNTGALAISDEFRCSGRHTFELFFHLHEDTETDHVETGAIEATWRGHRILFSSPARGSTWEFVRGSENPILGWRSRCFNQKQPILCLRIAGTLKGTTTICTDIRILK